MSILDKFFDGFSKKASAVYAFENDTSLPSDSEIPKDGNSAESFLDLVGDLALRQKINSSPYTDQPGTDLTNITLNDFPEVDSTNRP